MFSDPWQGASVLIVPGLNGSYSIRGVLGPGLSIRPQTAAARWRPDGTESTAADSLAPGTGEHILVTEQQHAREEDYQVGSWLSGGKYILLLEEETRLSELGW